MRLLSLARTANGLSRRAAFGDSPNPTFKICSKVVSGDSNNLMAELVRSKQYKQAFAVYRKMVDTDSFISFISCSGLLESFVLLGKTHFAYGVLGMMLKRGFVFHVYNFNILLKGLCSNGECDKALSLLIKMRQNSVIPDIISYNTVIRSFCDADKMEKVKTLFNELLERGPSPTVITFNIIVQRLFKLGKFTEASRMVKLSMERKLELNLYTYSGLIDGLCNLDRITEAIEHLDLMWEKFKVSNVILCNIVLKKLCDDGYMTTALKFLILMNNRKTKFNLASYNMLLWGLCKIGKLKEAGKLFYRQLYYGLMIDKEYVDIESFNAFIYGLIEGNCLDEAFNVWKHIDYSRMIPDASTYSIMFNGFSKLGMFKIAIGLFYKIQQPRVCDYNNLISALCKEQKMDEAWIFFKQIWSDGLCPDVVSFTTMIEGSFNVSDVGSALSLFNRMTEIGITPDKTTYRVMIYELAVLDGDMKRATVYIGRLVKTGMDVIDIMAKVLRHAMSAP